MKDYLAERLIVDMMMGMRVVYVTTPVADVFADLAARAERSAPGVVITRTNGLQEIRHPGGGLVRVRSLRSPGALRGLTADVVVIDAHDAPSEALDRVRCDAHIATMTAGGTVLVVAS